MLSLPATYSAQATGKNIVSDWLLELSYEDDVDGDGTFYFSGSDRTVTNFYHGNVISWGVIDESIDITKSQSSISDITIELANSWSNDTGLLSTELFGGNQRFINMDVTIRSWLPGCTVTADCLILYKGRLVDIKHNQHIVTLSIEKRSPYDRVKFPSVFSTNLRRLFPVAYGNFTKNTSTVSSQDFILSRQLYPTPVNDIVGEELMALRNNRNSANENPMFYEKNLNVFAPLDPLNETSVTYQGGFAIGAPITLKRGFDFRPNSISVNDGGDFSTPSNIIDGDTDTYTEVTFNNSSAGTYKLHIDIDVPNYSGRLTDIDIALKYAINLDAGCSGSPTILLGDASYGASSPQFVSIDGFSAYPNTNTGSATIHSVGGYEQGTWFDSDHYTNNNQLPATLRYTLEYTVSAGGTTVGYCRLYDTFIRTAAELDFANEEEAAYEKLDKIEFLYNGSDGNVEGFTGGTGTTAKYPHDIFRDMLNRYAGWDAAALDNIYVNGSVWSTTGTAGISIDQDRDWDCLWWATEQKMLVDVLKQLQFEGGFIWLFDNTLGGTTSGDREARVVYVKASYAASDWTLDGDNLANIDLWTTPFADMVTKRTFNYRPHPAEKKYFFTNSKMNSNRSDYNLDVVDALENAIEQNLDFVSVSEDVDELLTYYDNITGEPKLMVKCDLLQPSDWAMQVGDSVQFTNMVYDPYGKTWTTPIYFMCVNTKVSPNKFTATFREVG